MSDIGEQRSFGGEKSGDSVPRWTCLLQEGFGCAGASIRIWGSGWVGGKSEVDSNVGKSPYHSVGTTATGPSVISELWAGNRPTRSDVS